VGEKRLVRIDEAGRTSARATMIDNGVAVTPAKAESAAAEPAEDGVESAARRRGRRGGRRRSAAKATMTPSEGQT